MPSSLTRPSQRLGPSVNPPGSHKHLPLKSRVTLAKPLTAWAGLGQEMETPLPPSGSSGVAPLWTLSATPFHAPHASPRLWPAPHPHTLCPLCVLCWVPCRSHPVPHKSSKPNDGAQPVLPGRGWLPLMQQQGAPPPAALSHGTPQSLSVGGPGAHDLWVRRGHVPRSLHPALSPALTAGGRRVRSGVRPVSCTLGFYKTGLQTGENQIRISPAAGGKGGASRPRARRKPRARRLGAPGLLGAAPAAPSIRLFLVVPEPRQEPWFCSTRRVAVGESHAP